MTDALDRQELLTALTTEHFTLQGARSQTASEGASRASLYILSVSSTLVALGFIGQASQIGTTFDVFTLTVLPTLYVLGVFNFATVVAVINCVVGGSAIAIAIGAIAGTSLGVAAGVGGGAALVSLVALLRYADRLLEERAGRTESIFPSPQ